MRYTHDTYAKALANLLSSARSREEQKKLLAIFAKVAIRNGDAGTMVKTLSRTEELLAKRGKGDLVMIESARPLAPKLRRELGDKIPKGSHVEERVNPALIAGVRVTINGERELDASLKARLDRLFSA